MGESTNVISRSTYLTESIERTNFDILNIIEPQLKKGNEATFVTRNRREVIYRLIWSLDISSLIYKWKVYDHRAIRFKLAFERRKQTLFGNPMRTKNKEDPLRLLLNADN